MYESLFNTLSSGALSFIDSTVIKISSLALETGIIFGTLYVIWFGYQLWLGKIKEPAEVGLSRIVKLVVILGILSANEFYLGTIVKATWDTPDFLANLVTGNSNSRSSTSFLDDLLNNVLLLAEKVADTGGFKNVKPIFTAILMEVIIVISTAYAFFLFALSKIMVAILLSIGAFFIVMYMFESTQKFFEAWFNQIMNYMILYLLVSAILALLSLVIETSLNQALAIKSISLMDIIAPIVFIIVTWIILLQLTSISSALGGGVALSTLGAGAMAYRFISRNFSARRNINRAKGAIQGGKNTWKGYKMAQERWRGMRRNRARKI